MTVPARALRLGRGARGWIEAHPVAARWLLAGPAALLAALATMAAMPFWLPAGAAEVNGIVLPIMLTPLIWAVPFFYACLEPDLPRCALVLLLPILVQLLVVAVAIMSSSYDAGRSGRSLRRRKRRRRPTGYRGRSGSNRTRIRFGSRVRSAPSASSSAVWRTAATTAEPIASGLTSPERTWITLGL